jgi:hypothetical protein
MVGTVGTVGVDEVLHAHGDVLRSRSRSWSLSMRLVHASCSWVSITGAMLAGLPDIRRQLFRAAIFPVFPFP